MGPFSSRGIWTIFVPWDLHHFLFPGIWTIFYSLGFGPFFIPRDLDHFLSPWDLDHFFIPWDLDHFRPVGFFFIPWDLDHFFTPWDLDHLDHFLSPQGFGPFLSQRILTQPFLPNRSGQSISRFKARKWGYYYYGAEF